MMMMMSGRHDSYSEAPDAHIPCMHTTLETPQLAQGIAPRFSLSRQSLEVKFTIIITNLRTYIYRE